MIDFNYYEEEVKELLDEVYKIYGQYSAWKLRDLTHDEPTWKEHYNKNEILISHQELAVYFKTLIK